MSSPGIPDDLYIPLRDTLADCGSFDNNSLIRAVFAHAALRPWRNRLPEADTIMDRVDCIIDYLQRKQHAETQTNALVLLLGVLRDRTDPDDACYTRLAHLASTLNTVFHAKTAQMRSFEEANPENLHMIFTAEWTKLLECTQAVAKIRVPKFIQGRATDHVSGGTSWLIAPNLALTCWHVIQARTSYDKPISSNDLNNQVINSQLTFDYTLPRQGIDYSITALECYDPQLDYALLRLKDRIDYPLNRYGILKLDLDIPLTVDTLLYVIQHPKGQPQQLSAGRFEMYKKKSPTRILHTAPTEFGTSGAPVLNVKNWRVAALHNGEDVDMTLREATLLREIIKHIQLVRPDLHKLITNT